MEREDLAAGRILFFQAGNHAPLELSCFAALRVIATLFAVVLIVVEEETLLHIGMEAFLPLSFLRPRHPYREHASLPRRAHLLLFGQNYPPCPAADCRVPDSTSLPGGRDASPPFTTILEGDFF